MPSCPTGTCCVDQGAHGPERRRDSVLRAVAVLAAAALVLLLTAPGQHP